MFSNFSNLFLQILYSLSCMFTEVSVPLSQQSASDLIVMSINTWSQNENKTKTYFLNLDRFALSWDISSIFSQADYNSVLALSLAFHLFVKSSKNSQKYKLRVLLDLFFRRACIQPWACALHSRVPGICGSPSETLCLSPQSPPFQVF